MGAILFVIMTNIQWIDSKAFYKLHCESEVDAFGSISVYSHLLNAREGSHYIAPEPKIGGYKLLHHKTGISVNTLRKYVPELIKTGLGDFTQDGGFFLIGRETLAKQLQNKQRKYVPICLGENIAETKISAQSVIICSQIKNQQKRIDKKVTLLKEKRLLDTENGKISKKGRERVAKAIEKGFDFKNPQLVKSTVLSNKGFMSIIAENKGLTPEAKKQRGKRLKNKLIERGNIVSRRRFRPISNQYYTFNQYVQVKGQIKEDYSNLTYHNGRICEEITPEVAWLDVRTVWEGGSPVLPWNSSLLKEKVVGVEAYQEAKL